MQLSRNKYFFNGIHTYKFSTQNIFKNGNWNSNQSSPADDSVDFLLKSYSVVCGGIPSISDKKLFLTTSTIKF